MATDEKKKRPAAHEAIIKILTEATGKSIGSYLFAFADMYGLGAVAPAKAIPELIEAFRKALGSISEEKEAEPWMANIVNLSVKELQAQLAEARSEENALEKTGEKLEEILTESEVMAWISGNKKTIVLQNNMLIHLLSQLERLRDCGYELSGGIQMIDDGTPPKDKMASPGGGMACATFVKID